MKFIVYLFYYFISIVFNAVCIKFTGTLYFAIEGITKED